MKVFSSWLALAFGTFLAVAEAVRNSGEIQWWPFWVIDYLAVLLLMWGAVAILWRPSERGLSILTAGWGFTCAMFYMSLFSHISALESSGGEVAEINAQSALDEPWLTVVIGALFGVALVGLATSLIAEYRRPIEA